jgi:hypothetical protein
MASIFTLKAIEATWVFSRVSIEIISKMVGYLDIITLICGTDDLEKFNEDDFYGCGTDDELAFWRRRTGYKNQSADSSLNL